LNASPSIPRSKCLLRCPDRGNPILWLLPPD
jgi:hypothetical protein